MAAAPQCAAHIDDDDDDDDEALTRRNNLRFPHLRASVQHYQPVID